MPAFKTLEIDEHMAVVFLDKRFAAAFRALAYAWEGDRSPDLLPEIVRDIRNPKQGKRAASAGDRSIAAVATSNL